MRHGIDVPRTLYRRLVSQFAHSTNLYLNEGHSMKTSLSCFESDSVLVNTYRLANDRSSGGISFIFLLTRILNARKDHVEILYYFKEVCFEWIISVLLPSYPSCRENVKHQKCASRNWHLISKRVFRGFESYRDFFRGNRCKTGLVLYFIFLSCYRLNLKDVVLVLFFGS